jgi:ribose transport system ATP-binding protein
MSNYILEMREIKKAYGSTNVLKGVNFLLGRNEIHALIGENGAGKSTLMNILGGIVSLDEGEITIDDQKVSIDSPHEANALGISFIHQELNLVNDLTVYENLFLGNEITLHGLVDKKTMCEKTTEVLKRLHINLDPCTMVKDLDASYKQVVEIARSLLMNARVIIMDEPTTSLNETEINYVFQVMKVLKNNGVSIIFISHKLTEVLTICDSYSVLRDGCLVTEGKVDGRVTEIDLACSMVGREIGINKVYCPRVMGEIVLEVQDLSYEREFRNINFQLRKGEIAGFTGLLGDGRSELFSTIFGCKEWYEGRILINGKEVKMTGTDKAVAQRIGYIPRNRKENGIIKDLSILHNISIATLKACCRWGIIDGPQETAISNKHINEFKIKLASANDLITSLSGGNQQKVILAKWIEAKPDILIFDNPTQGVDIGAKIEIYQIIMKLAEEGICIVILSSEAQEVLKLCDKIYVMYHGAIRSVLDRCEIEIDEEKIMISATGGQL